MLKKLLSLEEVARQGTDGVLKKGKYE